MRASPRLKKETDMPIKYVKFKEWAGFVRRPDHPVQVDKDSPLHLERAAVLTSRLESASYGPINTYDGCGASAGILQQIAFDRRGNQGTLFRLIRRIGLSGPLASMFEGVGWIIDATGTLRNKVTGMKVTQTEFRKEVNQNAAGVTPSTGPGFERARSWAEAFHALFVDPRSYDAQLEAACAWLAGGHTEQEMAVYRRWTNADSMIAVPSIQLPPHVDLGMAMYHAFSANAPSLAAQYLANAGDSFGREKMWLQALAREFQRSTYGNWAERYNRTKNAARALGGTDAVGGSDHRWGWPTADLP